MKTIAYQTSLFQVRRTTNHKEYRELVEGLSAVDRILSGTGLEFEFAEYHLEKVRLASAEACGNPEVKLNKKQIDRYVKYAVQALRCNYLRLELGASFRECAFLIAASEDFQSFVFAGDFAGAKCPGKTKLHDFSLIVPDDFMYKMNNVLFNEFSKAECALDKFGLANPLDNTTLWLDATCLMASIHFPVDWVLLGDAVRTMVKGILCIRRHGLKHRIPAPESFISQMNSLMMAMANSRRQKDAKKRRKDTLRKIKKMCNIVKQHAQRYRDILASNWRKTDLSEKQAARIINRLDNVLEKLPAAMKQAQQRIIREEQVNGEDKIISLYDDSAVPVVRGKSGAEVEFGNELFIAEQADGFIVDWQLYEHKTADQKKFRDFMNRYQPETKQVETIAADRGFDGKSNRRKLEKNHIYNGLCPLSPSEFIEKRTDDKFILLQKRRSQTEGRVAAVKRFIGKHMPCRKFEFKQRHAAWAVFAHNLHLLAKLIAQAKRAKTQLQQTA